MPTRCLSYITWLSARTHIRGLENNVRALVSKFYACLQSSMLLWQRTDPHFYTFSLTNVMSYKYILCMRNLSFEPVTTASNQPDVHSFPRMQTTKLRLSFSCELISRQKCPPITLLLLFDQTAVSLADLNTCFNLHQKLSNAKLTFSLMLPTSSGKSLVFWELLQVIDHARITSYPANNPPGPIKFLPLKRRIWEGRSVILTVIMIKNLLNCVQPHLISVENCASTATSFFDRLACHWSICKIKLLYEI